MHNQNNSTDEDAPDAWYPLGPLQSGMLYDALRVGRFAGYDIEQVHVSLEESVDPSALGRAFQVVTSRHPALASEFRWESNGPPQQRAATRIELPIVIEDWSNSSEAEQRRRLLAFLANDRHRGFDLQCPPLARLHVMQMGSRRTDLVWTIHHILVDATSLLKLLDEVFSELGTPSHSASSLRPPPYRRYTEWAASIDREEGRTFFRDLLAWAPPPPPLPGRVTGKAPVSSARSERVTLRAAGDLLVRLKANAARTRITVGTILQAAWAVVLARHSGENDVVFGWTRACRFSPPIVGMEEMIGLVANTLPVRVRVDDDATVLQLLESLRAQNLAARAHEHTPLSEIQRQHEGCHAPIFDTTLTFQRWELNRALQNGSAPNASKRFCSLHELPVPPLNVRVCETESIEAVLSFDVMRLERSAVERLGAALLFTLEELLVDDTRRLGAIASLPHEVYDRVVFEWNRTTRAFPDHVLLHEFFEDRVREDPDAIAVEHGDERISYVELDRAANKLAHALRALGAAPGQFVAVCVGRGIGLVTAILAVAKSGAAYVPLDPFYPNARLKFVLEDCRAICVVTEERLRNSFGDAKLLAMDDEPSLRNFPSTRPSGRAQPTDVCYAIYTSGSTGEPNGVAMSHRAVANTLDWVNRNFRVGPGDRSLFVTSPCFDLSVYDIFGVLGAGATVVVASDPDLSDLGKLSEVLCERAITIWNSAPATLGAVLATHTSRLRSEHLRLVLLSGDWIPVTLPDAIRSQFPAAKVVSLGGATEAAIWSNWFPIDCVDPEWPSIPYGVPIQNCRYHILDSAMRPVPIGVAGDLYIGGTCLALGYLNRPELTYQRFVPDPFSGEPGQRLYKTGDRAQYLDNGQIRLLGRSDSQVKVRGFRVEIGEVEAAIRRVPGVEQGLAVAYRDESGEKAIGAYVVPVRGITLDARGVRERLAEELPTFAIPSQITFLEALPISKNGKIDRKALPSLSECLKSAPRVAPRSTVERQMVELWERVLQKGPIGVTDDFFSLGGHSLLAIALVSRVKAQFGWNVSLERLIARPTIEGLLSTYDSSSAGSEAQLYLTFNTRGKRCPIVFLPGIYGSPFSFRELPKLFGPEQPVYLGRAFDANGTPEAIVPSIEGMASAYLDELLTICDSRRLIIGGYSFGMLLAFEIACLASKRGVEVPLLVCLDGLAPGYPRFLPLGQRLKAHWREITGVERRRYLADRLEDARRRLLRAVGLEYALAPRVRAATPDMKRIFKRIFDTNVRASKNYHPTLRHSAELLLFRAELAERWVGVAKLDPYHGWGDFVDGEITVVTLPGDHVSVLQPPNDGVIAETMLQHLERIRGAQRRSGVVFGSASERAAELLAK